MRALAFVLQPVLRSMSADKRTRETPWRAAARSHALSLLGARERRWLSVWNRTSSPYPLGETVPSLFESQARRAAHRVAVVSGSTTLTYGELNRRANRIARALRGRGVGPEVVVGLCAERSLETIVALLGILKAGGAYLPLDPNEPAARLAAMLSDAAPALCLAQEITETLAAAAPCEVVELEALEAKARESEILDPRRRDDATGLAYVLYTSGSTGVPKAVSVVHRGIVRLVRGVTYARLDAEQTILQSAPLEFDASTFEIWGALLNGGRLVLAPPGPSSIEEIGEMIARHGVTTLWLTAGLFHLMVDHGVERLSPIKQLLAGGDVLSIARVRRVLRELPHCRLINGYGPTESTTFAASHPVRALAPDACSVPIGRPISNTRIYVMDGEQRCLPPGRTGEICIGGDGLAREYRNDPAKTAEKFLPDPLSDLAGARLYRTGDLGRILPSGELEFVGRADRQIKVSGFRIEPEEIETVLGGHEKVAQALVSVREVEGGEKKLVAHVMPRGGATCVEAELRGYLSDRLPRHMVPAEFLPLSRLPMTSGGKIDRHAALFAAEPSISNSAPPDSAEAIEEALHAIWRSVLSVPDIGLDENFFDAGGTSLALIEMHARLRKEFARDLPITDLFDHPTVRSLAAHLQKATRADRLRTVRDRILSGRMENASRAAR